VLVKNITVLLDITLELCLFFLATLSSSPGDFAFHMLDLEVSVVDQFLLSLLLDLKFADVGLQVAAGGQGATDVSNQVGLLSTEFKQFLGLLEKLLFLRPNFLLNFHHHSFGLLVLIWGVGITLLKSHLHLLFLAQTVLGSSKSLFGGLEPLHLFFQNFVDAGYIAALIVQFGSKGGQLVTEDNYLALETVFLLAGPGNSLTNFGQMAILTLNSMLRTIVVFFLALQAGLMSLELRFLVVKEVLVNSECLTFLGDKSITTAGVFNGFLPLEIELVALLMKSFKFLGGFVKFNLGGLGFSDFLFKFAALTSHLDGKFLDLKSKLLNLGLVGASVLFQSEVVFFLLASGEGPLFKFLLVPVHFKFELVHLFVGFKDHVLDVVETILLVGNALLELFNFVFEAAGLAFGDLLHVFLGFDFLVFVVDEGLGVD
jgi:hypothetical protein